MFDYPDLVYEHKGNAAIVGDWLKNRIEAPFAHLLAVMYQGTGCDQYQVDVVIDGAKELPLIWGNARGVSRVVATESRIYLPSSLVRIGPDGKPISDDLRRILDLIWRAWGVKSCPL